MSEEQTVEFIGEACGTCRYGLNDPGGQQVTCRRYPPAMLAAETLAAPNPKRGGIVTVTSGVTGHFPTMLAKDGWCGEYDARREAWRAN